MSPDVALVLALSVTDWAERTIPPILFAFGLVVLAMRARERRRGPDAEDEDV